MTEYERLKEEIIATAAGYTGDIKALTTRLMTIIAERCYLKVSGSVDLTTIMTGHLTFTPTTFQEITDAYRKAGYMPVKEIKKEE